MLLNEPEIRRRTVEARNSAGELTKAQKLADAISITTTGHNAAALRALYEAMHDPLPQPGANKCEAGPELPPPLTIVVYFGHPGVVWRAVDHKTQMKCVSANSNHFYIAPGHWRFATDAEMDAFFTECPR